MPKQNPKNCAKAGCINPTYARFCDTHRKDHWKVKAEIYGGNATNLYNNKVWRNTRADVLHLEPFCRTCALIGIDKVATEVDHITPHNGNMELFWNRENLQPLCIHCHSSKTMTETRAKMGT
jgi:5-methylcytosine-specific restriction protein A